MEEIENHTFYGAQVRMQREVLMTEAYYSVMLAKS